MSLPPSYDWRSVPFDPLPPIPPPSTLRLVVTGLFLPIPGKFETSLVAQLGKNPPAMQETLVQFLGWEDPLEEGMATYSSILAPIDRRAWRATLHGVAKSQTQLSD